MEHGFIVLKLKSPQTADGFGIYLARRSVEKRFFLSFVFDVTDGFDLELAWIQNMLQLFIFWQARILVLHSFSCSILFSLLFFISKEFLFFRVVVCTSSPRSSAAALAV